MIRSLRDPLFFRDKGYWTQLLTLALPIALQNLITSSLNLTDNLMVGQLGEHALGALALANQLTFLAILFLYGIGSGASVFASQYWGSGDGAGVKRTQGAVLVLALVPALAFAVLCVWQTEGLLGFYTSDPETLALGSSYLRISALSFPLIAVTFGFSMILRSTGHVRIPLTMSIIAVVLNIVLNYCLIFGWFGLPALGVVGSALGTLIARFVEATGIVVFSYLKKTPNAGRLGELFHFSRAFVAQFLKVGLPVLANDLGWALAMTTLMAVYAHLGTDALAAVSITDTLGQFLNIFIFGSMNATSILTGNLVGAGRIFRTKVLVRRTLRFSVVLGLAVGGVLAIAAPFLPGLFHIGAEAREQTRNLLWAFACLIPFRSFLYHQTVGLFRGAGDTRFALFLEVGGIWLLGLPPALLAAFVFHAPVWVVFASAVANEAILCLVAVRRFRTDRWIKPVTAH
jgi:putative MATE family efflux protein